MKRQHSTKFPDIAQEKHQAGPTLKVYTQDKSCKHNVKFNFLEIILESKSSWRVMFQDFREPKIKWLGSHGGTFITNLPFSATRRLECMKQCILVFFLSSQKQVADIAWTIVIRNRKTFHFLWLCVSFSLCFISIFCCMGHGISQINFVSSINSGLLAASVCENPYKFTYQH